MASKWIRIEANRSGFLWLAATLLRAAVEPILANDCISKSIPVGEEYPQVFQGRETFVMEDVRRVEAWPEPEKMLLLRKRRAWRRDKLALIGCAVVAFGFLFFFVSGVAFWWTLATGSSGAP